MRSSRPAGFAAIVLTLLLAACASTPAAPAQPNPCADSLYLRLRASDPDSLSERQFVRLRDLEQSCTEYRRQYAQSHGRRGGMMGRDAWLWMPAMMLVVATMAIMMGWPW